jgi:hypothetical protein
MPFTSEETSLSFGWLLNFGSGCLTETTAVRPSLMSSPPRPAFRSLNSPADCAYAEPGQVGAAVLVLDVVGEAEDRVLERVVPLHRDLDPRAVLLALDDDGLVVHDGLAGGQIRHELGDAALEEEVVRLAAAFVLQGDGEPAVQVRQLPQALRQDVEAELGDLEDRRVRLEGHLRPGLVRDPDRVEPGVRIARPVLLVEDLALALDLQLQPFGQGVDDRHADAVQTARDLVVRVVELATRVQHGHDDLGRGALLRRVLADRDAAAVVLDGDRAVVVDLHVDPVAVARQSLVDGVVDDLVDHVMQPGAVVGVPDVHAGALPHRLEPLEDLDALFVVGARGCLGRRRSFHAHDRNAAFSWEGDRPRRRRGSGPGDREKNTEVPIT